ncbi:hypothetical protein [Bartonella bacilliformis]|uniref:Uncharacterized protein n=1 Tax=Bartonella bacilliformis Ver097 TaxID=1293911 RepID=A0A072R799_BARBA|nr:hypothetical protein [Bartonella bacilliformis]KEG21072.1 hypothetical protein H710_00016 [Bartonella bacilliformis Ver097]
MSAKRAAVITISTILAFIFIIVGIGSIGADRKHTIAKDGYGISTKHQ